MYNVTVYLVYTDCSVTKSGFAGAWQKYIFLHSF